MPDINAILYLVVLMEVIFFKFAKKSTFKAVKFKF